MSFDQRITAAMLNVISRIKNIISIFKLLSSIIRLGGGIVGSTVKAWRIFFKEGWGGVQKRIFFVDSYQGKLLVSKIKSDIDSSEINKSYYQEPVIILPFNFSQQRAQHNERMAVILHAFHANLAPEFISYLRNICRPFDLFVSTDTKSKADFLQKAFAGITTGMLDVRVVQNRGRDIAPKLITFRDIYNSHSLILHLHTKMSLHDTHLAGWRDFILKCLLGSPAVVESVLEAFMHVPNLGIIAPRNFPKVRPYMNWGVNFEYARTVAARMGIAITPDSPLDFPCGSMFWARSAALKPLLDLNLSFDDFPMEIGQTDGTLSHVIERLYFYSCEKAGLRWFHAGYNTKTQPPECRFIAKDYADLERCVSDQMPALLLPGLYPRPTGIARITSKNDTALKQTFRECCRKEMEAFLSGDGHIILPVSDNPKISVIMVLFNQAELTFHCLQSLQSVLDVPAEVIIVDNASSDRTNELLTCLDGAHILRNSVNQHFLHGVNTGSEYARGEYLLILNNDTRVKKGSISAACRRLDKESDIGAVGGKIVFLNGMLQEAGSIIWRDGSCIGYGCGRDPGETEFQFCRDVDYCSGAFLMVRRNLFENIGRLDTAFAPAYYEETDLCMRIRNAGFRVVYEPDVEVTHFEFGSTISLDHAILQQQNNRKVFVKRHKSVLKESHFPAGTRLIDARMRMNKKGRVLIMDDRIPVPSLGAGYARAMELIKAVIKAGWFVTYYPVIFPYVRFNEAYSLFPRDVEILAGCGRENLPKILHDRCGYYDAVIVSRPHNMKLFDSACRLVPAFLRGTPLLYDAEAVFAMRDILRTAQSDKRVSAVEHHPNVRDELAMANQAKIILTVNEIEASLFRKAGHRDVRVLGNAVDIVPTITEPSLRKGLLFVGALDDDDSPNVDSLIWFVHAVMPKLDRLIGEEYILNVIGRNGAPRIQRLAGKRVKLLGRIDNIRHFYEFSRLFIAPTRFSAGIPTKIQEAASYGLPVVATPLLSTQLDWTNGVELLTAESPHDFAVACQSLYKNDAQWLIVREAALARVAKDCSRSRFETIVGKALCDILSSSLRETA